MSIRTLISTSLFTLALSSTPALAKDDPKVAAEVIELAKAQWAAEIANKPIADQLASLADDYTEINNDFPVRVDGKALNSRLGEAGLKDGGKSLVADLANAKVQVYGDTAILSYNYLGMVQSKDGKVKPQTGKSTRVYAKIDGKWKLVHAHFSPVTAPKD